MLAAMISHVARLFIVLESGNKSTKFDEKLVIHKLQISKMKNAKYILLKVLES